MAKAKSAALPQLKRVAQFEVEGQIFTTQRAAMQHLHRAQKGALAAAIVALPKDADGKDVAWTGANFGLQRPKLDELFLIGTIQRSKKVKVHEKVEAALQALIDEANAGDGLTAEFLLKNEERFEAALKANRPVRVLTDEEKQVNAARLAGYRETKAAEKAAAEAAK